MRNKSMQMTKILLALFLLSKLSISYGKEADNTKPYIKSEFSIPKHLEKKIQNYPQAWKRLTGFEFSGLHWNQFVVVFINKEKQVYRNNHLEYLRVFEEDLDEEEDEILYKKYPEGTMILKESFINKNGKPGDALLLSGMIKHKPGFDPDYGDWEYFQSDKNGNILFSGNSKDKATFTQCIDCHQNINSRDYVFATQYSITQ